MSNINLHQKIVEAYNNYVIDSDIEKFQNLLETCLTAMERHSQNDLSSIKEIMNDIEYIRFMYQEEEQPFQVERVMIKLKNLFE